MTTIVRLLALFFSLAFLASCGGRERPALPTLVGAAPTSTGSGPATEVAGFVPPTWTAAATAALTGAGTARPTFTPRPSRTPAVFPSNTPRPSPTPEDTPTPSVTETPTAPPTATPAPTVASGLNLLPNPSFEESWYHIGGVPELQVPNRWQLQWESGANPLDHDPAPWVRPESRVLTPDFLPADEHDLFIWDGRQTVKIFKGEGAISFRLLTTVRLEPGSYLFEISVFPDLVSEYTDEGSKVWAPDPLSGEVRFVVGNRPTEWILPTFGQKNTFTHAFQIQSAQMLQVGAAMRGRWAIENNGWFMDDWALYRIGD